MPKAALDRIDLKILAALQRDARIANSALAAEVGLSASPCHRRVARLHEQGVIQSMLTVVDPKALGLEIEALVHVRIRHHGETASGAIETKLRAMPEVLSCFLVAGTVDYVLHVVSADVAAHTGLVKRIGGLDGISEIQSSIILQKIKPWSPVALDSPG